MLVSRIPAKSKAAPDEEGSGQSHTQSLINLECRSLPTTLCAPVALAAVG